MVETRRGGGSRWGRPERSLPRRRSSFPNRRRHVEPTAAATPFAGRDRHHVRLVFSTTEAMSCSLSVGECRSCVCMTATGKLREGDVVPLPHGPCGHGAPGASGASTATFITLAQPVGLNGLVDNSPQLIVSKQLPPGSWAVVATVNSKMLEKAGGGDVTSDLTCQL